VGTPLPVITVAISGVGATGQVGTMNYFYWTTIDDNQIPNWQNIVNSQTPDWVEVEMVV
jgi:hypothetical protein